MQLLGTVQGQSTFSSQAETTVCLTGYTGLHLTTARGKMVEGSPQGHLGDQAALCGEGALKSHASHGPSFVVGW